MLKARKFADNQKGEPRNRTRMSVTPAQKRRLFRDLSKVDPEFIRKISPFLEGLYEHYFRCEISGWENVPEKKALYVGNHNGLVTYEVLMVFHAWWKRFGGAKRALGLAHGLALDNPLFRWIMPRIGAIPADPEVAAEAFERDYNLLVYPGGEKEAMRASTEKRKVDFFQRKGFLRLALKSGVPIVPIVSVGAHETFVILHRGEEIAEKLGLKEKYRLHGMPITYRSLFFLWCVASGLFTFFPLLLAPMALASVFIPLPAKMTFRILPPIDLEALRNPALSEEENLQMMYNHVLAAMQTAHDEEYAKRKYPVLG